MRHWNNGTDHRRSKSCCDKSSPARRTISPLYILITSLCVVCLGTAIFIQFYINTYVHSPDTYDVAWWRHQMETFSALLAICAGNSPVPGEFPAQRPETRSLDVFFDLRLNKRLSKQSRGWWFETLSHPLWRHRNEGKIGHNDILRLFPHSRPNSFEITRKSRLWTN